MKLTLAAAFAAAMIAAPAMAADVAGLWLTPTNGGQVEISHCGAQLCGKLVNSNRIAANPDLRDDKNKDAAQRGRTLKGLPMLTGFTGGPTKWTGGKVYNPDDGGTYSGSIEMLNADELKLKGCIIAPLCKTQVWKRVR